MDVNRICQLESFIYFSGSVPFLDSDSGFRIPDFRFRILAFPYARTEAVIHGTV